MRQILFGFHILCLWNLVLSLPKNEDMVDVAVVEEMFSMTKTPQLIKGRSKTGITKAQTDEPDLGTGVPDEFEFEVQITTAKPTVLHLKRSKDAFECKDILIPEENNQGENILVRADASVDEGMGIYKDLENGGIFTVDCKGISYGECEPVLQGSFFHEGSEYDLQPISDKSPGRVKRNARQERLKLKEQRKRDRQERKLARKQERKRLKEARKQQRSGLKLERKQKKLERRRFRQLRKSQRKAQRKEGKRLRKLYAVLKRKKDKQSFNDYSRKNFKRKFRGRKRLSKEERLEERKRRKKLREQIRTNRKLPSSSFEFIEISADSNTSPVRIGEAQAVGAVTRMVDSGSKVMQTSREVTKAAVQQQTTAEIQYGVEVLVVVDFSIYTRFLDSSEKTTAAERAMDAKKNIRRYFAHILNGMDVRYKQIVRSDFAIKVGVIGYIIADTPGKSWMTTGEPILPRVAVNASRVLENMVLWKKTMKALPKHDHMMLFTGHDLYQPLNSTLNDNAVAGLAYVGALCSDASVSVCEDIGDYGGVNTGTHELGHSLNARHDGDRPHSHTCPPGDHYIMSPKSGFTTERTKLNPFKFSNCSIKSFRIHFDLLNNHSANCLLDEVIIFMESDYNDTISEMPGQILEPHEQCRRKLGVNSFYGWGGPLGEMKEICTTMACKKPDTESQYNIYSAARGTSCGDKKWCINGICTDSPNAPNKDDNCVHNDSLRLINGLTCNQTINDFPGNCYMPFYQTQCCDSCKKAANTSLPKGCEWGDQTPACAEIQNDTSLCYKNEELCCITCPQYDTGNEYCKYGDKWSNCSVSGCHNETYASGCCKTCNVTTAPKTTTTTTTSTTTTTTTTVPSTTNSPTGYCVNEEMPLLGMTCGQLDKIFKAWGRDICYMNQYRSCCMELSVCSGIHPIDCNNDRIKSACRCNCKPQKSAYPGCKELPMCSNVISVSECAVPSIKALCGCTCNALETGVIPASCTEELTCSSKNPTDCYNNTVRSTCTCSCRSRQALSAGCFELRACYNIRHPSECYSTSTSNVCGCTCQSFHTGIPNCNFGDRLPDCAAYHKAYDWFCGLYKDYCCVTCNGTTQATGSVSPPAQALQKIEVSIDALSVPKPPSHLTLNKPVTSTNKVITTTQPTREEQLITKSNRRKTFQEMLQERREQRRKRLQQIKTQSKKRPNSRIQQILEMRRKQRDRRLLALQEKRKLVRGFRG